MSDVGHSFGFMSTASPTFAPASVVDDARELIADLGDTLWSAKRPEDLLQVVRSIETLKSTLEAVELSVVDEIDATDAATVDQWASARDFVTAVAGAKPSYGATQVRLAHAVCKDYLDTHAALADGWLSREKARVIVRVLDRLPVKPALRATGEEAMLEAARELDVVELEAVGARLLELLDPEGSEKRAEKALDKLERAAHLGRFLSIIEDGLGGVRVKGRGTVEDAAKIKAALLTLTKPLPQGHPECGETGRDPRDHSTRLWDALVEGCQKLMDADVLPECHGAKPRISLTMSYEALLTQVGTATLETGERLSAAAVKKLACDADLFPIVLGAAGEVLDVGRMQRLVTAAIWKALVARDGHCRFPGCKRPPIACDAHHIKHWVDGGETSLINMVLLCGAHHTMIHNSPWQVRMNPIDQQPEFIPPARIDPQQRPIRHRCPRGNEPPSAGT